MSKLTVNLARMKLKQLFPELERNEGQLIAAFGGARLIRSWSGTYKLRGGTKEDHGHALEWISLFLHEAVLDERACASKRTLPQPAIS
jgi:hypothetical protein